jgi:dsRNA-specific ribonuclease
VKAKILADLIEAIIGAFYLEGGINMAIDAMKALGVWPTFGIDDLLAASFQSELKTIVVENNNEENKDNKLETIKNNKNNNVEKELNESLETATRKDMKKRTMDGNGVLFTTDAFKETLEDDSINQFNFPPEYPELMRKVAEGTATLDAIKRMEKSFSEPSSIVDNQFYLNKCGKIEQAKQISELNKKIGYTFKNTKLMDEAFTHCSLSCKKSNQRLEFLGDAVLDFAIVSLLFKHLPWATQGDLSGGKSNAACNKNLAYFCADLELYKFLKLASPQLALDIEAIHEIVVNNKKKMSNNNINNNSNNDNNNGEISQNKEQEKKEDINSNEELKILENNDEDENIKKKRKVRRNDDNIVMNEIEEDKKKLKVFGIKGVVDLAAGPMKALADTFEAIIGAIYLDSGGSMEAICKVIKHINLLPALSNSNSNSNSS